MDFVNLPLFAAAGLVFASVLVGLFSARIGLSSLLVFLLAGILVGEEASVACGSTISTSASRSATWRWPSIFASTGLLGGSGFLAVYLFGLIVANRAATTVEPALVAMDGYAWLAQPSMPLGEWLSRELGRPPVAGDRVRLDGACFVVRAHEAGNISNIGLSLER